MSPGAKNIAAALLGCLILESLAAEDWPQFLGPNRNGTTSEQVASGFPKDGPAKAWSRKVGNGFSGPVVFGNKVILHQRIGGEEIVEAMETATGKVLWQHSTPTTYSDDFGFDDGPRGTPSVSDGIVVTFGANGLLAALSLDSGRVQWQVDTRQKFHPDKGFFGPACSPLVRDGLVLLNVGGRDTSGVVAFHATTGEVAWRLSDDEAGYASPVPAVIDGVRLTLFFTRAGLLAVGNLDGKERFSFPWRSPSHASVNAASPVWEGNQVFLSSSYGTGAVLLKVNHGKPELVWSGDESLSAHYSTPVLRDGYLYGFHGRVESKPDFRCISMADGKVKWSAPGLGAGNVVMAGGQLVLLLETGELVIAARASDKFEVKARAQILGSGTRACFAIGQGKLFARDPRQIIAITIAPETK
jgi:outer membrane protein assembly factor BamB